MKTLLFYRILGMLKNTGADWDRLAPAIENAIDFAHTNINPEPVQMIDAYRFSWEYCLAHSGESLNEHLREDRTNKEDIAISDMVAGHSCKTDLVLYRGVCDYVYNLMKQNASSLEGVDFYEKGYMQCSLVKGQEINSKIKLRIFIPAGSCVIYLGNVNDEQGFYEVDIQHGAKLELISIDKTYINCKLLSTK
ncbi:MAG: hypothetical protein II688_04520 [Lachnospiraceae bacterium]|nr:hypothetical protein [Lachnospiraceae bacterium]